MNKQTLKGKSGRPALKKSNSRSTTSRVVKPAVKKNSLAEETKKLVAQSKLIKSLAHDNARQQLMEAFTPQIKRIVSRTINEDEFSDEEDVDPIDGEAEYTDEESSEPEITEEDDEFGDDESHEEPDGDESFEDEGEPDGDEITEEDEDPEIAMDDIPSEEEDAATEAELEELMASMSDEEGGEGEPEITEEEEELEPELAPEVEASEEEEFADSEEDDSTGDTELDEYIKKINSLFINEGDADVEGQDADYQQVAEGEGDEGEESVTDTEASEEGPSTEELEGELEEAYRKLHKVGRIVKEQNKALRIIKQQMNETTLFNAKLTYVNKILAKNKSLTNADKMNIIESFDAARSVREVTLVYNSIQRSLISERRRSRNTSNVNSNGAKKSTKSRATSEANRKPQSLKESIRQKLKEKRNGSSNNGNRKTRLVEGMNKRSKSSTDSTDKNKRINAMRKVSLQENINYKPASELNDASLVAKWQKLANITRK